MAGDRGLARVRHAPLTHDDHKYCRRRRAPGTDYVVVLSVLAVAAAGATYALARRSRDARRSASADRERPYAAVLGLIGAGRARHRHRPVRLADRIARHVYDGLRRPVLALRQRPISTAACSVSPAASGSRSGRSPGTCIQAHSLLGSGAGTYARYWNQLRPVPVPGHQRPQPLPRDARRARSRRACRCFSSRWRAPLVAAVRARQHALVAAAAAAYVAFLAHAGDRLGLADAGRDARGALRAPAVSSWRTKDDRAERLTDLPTPGDRGNGAWSCSGSGRSSGCAATRRSPKARRPRPPGTGGVGRGGRGAPADWAPWSSQPPQLLGEAQAGDGNRRRRAHELHAGAVDRRHRLEYLARPCDRLSGAARDARARSRSRSTP